MVDEYRFAMPEPPAARVFLSHTAELREFPAGRSFVDAAEAAVNRAGGAVTEMAYFSAADDKPSDYCQKLVRSCDVYVGLIGLRYGSPVRDRPDVSYTELEFDTATDAGMPRLIFMLDDTAPVPIPPARLLDQEQDFQIRQRDFRARLLDAGVTVRTFCSAEGLELEIFQALKAPPQPRAAKQQNTRISDFYFAPGNASLFEAFEGLRDVCLDPSSLERDLDLARFTGREWLIGRLDQFIEDHARGYVIIRGEAGVGKSCLAAHLVRTRPWLQHFTELPGGRSPLTARKSLAAQLIARWGLRDWAPDGVLPAAAGRQDWFAGVLHAAARQRDVTEPTAQIVLVIDGLDHAEDARGGGLPLGLPSRLPDGVYVVATSRFGIERALHAVRSPADWLKIEVEGAANLDDMRRYIEHVTDAEMGDQRLTSILAESGTDVSSFRDHLAERCAGIWIYLRYVLEEIQEKDRKPSAVGHLPRDLAGFYAEQIERWRGAGRGSAARRRWEGVILPLLGVLGVSRGPLTPAELGSFATVPEGIVADFVGESARAFLNRQDDRTGPRYSVRHQSLRDLLTGSAPDARPDVVDLAQAFEAQSRRAHHGIAAALVPPGEPGERSWLKTTSYARSHLAAHAAECGLLDDLVTDPGFLAVVSPGSVLAHRTSVGTTEAHRAIEAFELSLGGWESCTHSKRIERLAINAAKLRAFSLLAASSKMTTADWTISWAAWSGRGHRTLDSHDGWVRAAAVGRVGDRDIIVSGTLQGTLQIWDAVTGEMAGPSLTSHQGPILSVVIGRVAGRDVIVSGSGDRTIRIWDAATGQPIGQPLTGHNDNIWSVAIGQAAGRDIIASGSGDRTIRIWDAATGQPIGQPLTGHNDNIWSVAIGQAAGRDIIASGSGDRTIRIWDAATGQPIGQPLTGHNDNIWSVAIGQAAGRDIIASGSGDRTIRIWDAATGQPIGQPLTGHESGVGRVAVGRVGDLDIIASSSNDRTVRVWDARTGRPIGQPLSGHDDNVGVVAIGRAADRDIIVSGSNDGTVRIWNVAGAPADEPRAGHNGSVWAVAIGRAGDRDIVVSGSHDHTIRVWDAATGQSLGRQIAVHRSAVLAVACGRVKDRDIIVSGSDDGTVRICDANSHLPLAPALARHRAAVLAVACGQIGDRDIVVTGSDDRTVRMWDAVTLEPIGTDLVHGTAVRAVATGRAGDRDIIVSGSSNGRLRIWDGRTCDLVCPPLAVHHGWLRTVAVGKAGDRDIIVAGTLKGGIQIWDAITAEPIRLLQTGRTAPALAIALGHADGRDIIVSGDGNGSVQAFDAVTYQPVGHLLTCHSDWVLAVAIGQADGHDIIISSSHDRAIFAYERRLGR